MLKLKMKILNYFKIYVFGTFDSCSEAEVCNVIPPRIRNPGGLKWGDWLFLVWE
jgi:hypothetical protein